MMWTGEKCCSYWDLKSDPSAVQPVAIRYTDRTVPALDVSIKENKIGNFGWKHEQNLGVSVNFCDMSRISNTEVWLLIAEAKGQSHGSPCGIYGGRNGNHKVILSELQFIMLYFPM
jgi:hypothetical protein